MVKITCPASFPLTVLFYDCYFKRLHSNLLVAGALGPVACTVFMKSGWYIVSEK